MIHRRSSRVLLIVAAFALFLVPVAAIAAGGFTDVDDDSVFVADIQWMKDNGITKGCNPPTNDRFCPGSNVTREQMSAFMHRLAVSQVVDAKTAVNADHAKTADTAAEAENANRLGNKAPSAFESHAYESRINHWVPIASNTTSELVTLNLPAGAYLIQATGGINNNGAAVNWGQLDCALTAGSSSYSVGDIYFPADGVGDTMRATWMLTHTFDAPGTVGLSCTATASWAAGNMWNPTITAISVQSATANVAAAAAGAVDGQG